MALLDIRNLNIEIQTPNGRIKIVDGVNLSLNEGEILGLVGESGSGKSLIAKVISNSIKENWTSTSYLFSFYLYLIHILYQKFLIFSNKLFIFDDF